MGCTSCGSRGRSSGCGGSRAGGSRGGRSARQATGNPGGGQERLKRLRKHRRDDDAAWGLNAVDVVSPPGASTPPRSAEPDAACLSHLAQCAVHGLNTVSVRSRADLAEVALEAGLLEPLSGDLQTLGTDCVGDTGGRCARTVGVEVLVHLNRGVVEGVLNGRLCEGC